MTTHPFQDAMPSLLEVLPSQGSRNGGDRIAILGHNFINSPNLTVMFGAVVSHCIKIY